MPHYYQNTFNLLPAPILLVNQQGCIVDLNLQYLACFIRNEYSREELLGKVIFNCPVMLEMGLTRIYEKFLNGTNTKVHSFQVNLTNSLDVKYYAIEAIPLDFSANEPGFIFVHVDTTDKVISRLSLERNQVLLDEIQEVSGLGSWDLHIPSGKATWSREEYFLLGYDPEKDVSSADNFIARVHEEDRPHVLRALEQPFIDKSNYQAEFRLQMPDGTIRYVLERGRVLFDDEGKAIRFLGTTLDITQRVEAERKLAESKNELTKILDDLQDTYYRTDSEGRIVRASSSVYDLLGYQPEDVVGMKIIELYVDPSDRQRLMKQLEESGGRVHDFKARLKCKDGSIIWVSSNVHYYIHDDKILGIEGTTRDITHIKKIEEELQNHKKHLEQLVSERTQELESFSYSVSHDLRAPLRSINGFGQALEEEYKHLLDETGKDYLRRVRSATHHMANLIDDLMQLTTVNRQVLVLENVRLDKICHRVFAELEQLYPDRRVEIVVAPKVVVQGDAGLLTIGMRNLLENAWKYTSKRVDARIEFGVVDKPLNGQVVYFVRDNGVGLDMKYANKLFVPFQRLHKIDEFEGTGIGLAIVNRVLARHGGSVWVESNPNEGATFYFTLSSETNLS